ncbi:retinol dehydrogenase 13-like [Diorhabda sublineata]|uniref:retinol dehydrogenase 13-like n=1 Tax=Diorhabda sublineata TaxID=1163346 RepID=UPI0024E194C4|nr:retinol dehydrogenase 13-like [Diorhabda sublineata]
MLGYFILAAVVIFIIVCLTLLIITTRFGHLKCESYECLIGKTAVVTGGSSGIGYQIVLSLASRGCKVIIIDRIVDESIKNSIVEETDNPNISLEYADLASFKSVRRVAQKLNKTEEKLDILINNAGIGLSKGELTEDGLQPTMQINYYSHFLLTHLLIDLLKKSGKGKIVFTSSLLSFLHVLLPSLSKQDNLDPPNWLDLLAYTNTKFLTIVASDIFAEKLKKFNITCNTYHPSVANTTIFSKSEKNLENILDWSFFQFLKFLVFVCAIHPKLACQPALLLSVSKEYEKVTGIFYGNFLPKLKPRGCGNKKFCKNIWEISENIVKLEPEEILQ